MKRPFFARGVLEDLVHDFLECLWNAGLTILCLTVVYGALWCVFGGWSW